MAARGYGVDINIQPKCEVCDRTDAQRYCVDCAQYMCDACLVTHGKLKASQSHEVVSLSAPENKKENAMESVLMVVGLDVDPALVQDVLHISLTQPNSVCKIGSAPAWLCNEAVACVMGITLYAVGIGNARNELWKWNAVFDWVKCSNMGQGRRKHGVAVVDATLYVLGGWVDYNISRSGHNFASSSIDAYQALTNKWSSRGSLKVKLLGSACVAYKNVIYMFGGGVMDDSGNFTHVTFMQMYDTAEHKCTFVRDAIPEETGPLRAAVWETSAILIGAHTCFIYNFESQTWQKRQAFKTGLAQFGLILDKGILYIAGGGSDHYDRQAPIRHGVNDDNPGYTQVWKYTDEVQCVSVHDVVEDTRGARWKHHATLPRAGLVSCYSGTPLVMNC